MNPLLKKCLSNVGYKLKKNTRFQYCAMSTFRWETSFLNIPESAEHGPARSLAYSQIEGKTSVKEPGVIYIPGFMAHGTATKATYFMGLCEKEKIQYIAYDPSGLGRSVKTSPKLSACRFSLWLSDAIYILKHVASGPQILVGSSMGCMLASILAQRFPDRVKGIMAVSPAINFGREYYDKITTVLPDKVMKKLEQGATFDYYNPDYGTMPVSLGLFEDMVRHDLPEKPKSLDIKCPVRIIYSYEDKEITFKSVLKYFESLSGSDVQFNLLKTGHHQLHEESKLNLLGESLLTFRKHVSTC